MRRSLGLIVSVGAGVVTCAHAADRLTGGPLDRGGVTTGFWCSMESFQCTEEFYQGVFTPTDTEVTITFRALHQDSTQLGSGSGDVGIDNVSVVEKSVYDAHMGPVEGCGGYPWMEAFFFHSADSLGLVAYTEQFHEDAAGWDLSEGTYYSDEYSAPNNLYDPPWPESDIDTGGSLALGALTDPSKFVSTQFTVNGLTPGVEHVLTFWWKGSFENNGFCFPEIDMVGFLTVDVWSADTWVEVASHPGGQSPFGGAWGDYDLDGDADLYVLDLLSSNELFRNDAGTLVALPSPPNPGTSFTAASSWADHDNDGDLDLAVGTFGAANALFRNDGAGTFVDVASGPLSDVKTTWGLAWADYDGDLDLDLYVSNDPGANQLLRNDGNDTFVDVAGAPINLGPGSSQAAWGDVDGDGDPDLFVGRRAPQTSALFRNDDAAFVDVTPPDLTQPSVFGAAWGDLDADDDLDLVTGNENGSSRIFRNDAGTLVDVTPATDFAMETSAVALDDVDADGDLDLYFGKTGGKNKLYRNDDGVFVDIRAFALERPEAAYGGAFADVEGDGVRELFVAYDEGSGKTLFRNDDSAAGHWLQVELRGTTSNATGIGSRVRVFFLGDSQMREVGTGSGFGSENEPVASFGLGSWTALDSVEVRWPSGTRSVIRDVGADQRLTITEPTLFSDVAVAAGVADPGDARGAAWRDFDRDGDDDLFVARDQATDLLYRNEGGGTFVDVGTVSGVAGETSNASKGTAWADYDNDGDPDLYVSRSAPNYLYRNEGNGTFVDVAVVAGVASASDDRSVAWADFDDDGHLDLYVTSHDGRDRLFWNQTDGTFVDVAGSAGVDPASARSRGAAWSDYDHDGDLDLYVASNLEPNRLLRNESNATFTDVASIAGVDDAGPGNGVAWGDYDGDGHVDLCVTNGPAGAGRLYRNDGDGTFTDLAPGTGVVGTDRHRGGLSWLDVDNDGDLDLVAAIPSGPNEFYLNGGDGTFVRIDMSGIVSTGVSAGVATADYDGDGDLDVFIASIDSPNRLFRNDSSHGNGWLAVDLRGAASNRDGIGALVRVYADGTEQVREVGSGSGFLSSASPTAYFGLGDSPVDSVTVDWPSGAEQTLPGTPVGHRVLFLEDGPVSTDSTTPTFDLRLHANRPNPFALSTSIGFDLSDEGPIELTIFDVTGRVVRRITNDRQPRGTSTIRWDGVTETGVRAAAGVYFYRLTAGEQRLTRRMALIR